MTIVELRETPAVAGVFYALTQGWGLNAVDAKVTQRRREEGMGFGWSALVGSSACRGWGLLIGRVRLQAMQEPGSAPAWHPERS